ncbi:hypothetical protein BM477_05885 [Boudabousia marimammalium]|uniref:Uncharacterized protein n=2 Tax=Boudabousia marimammalium TaxID=156892 RepID=A0A1Q5PMH4_9ACTO|nr:hypothetical protein BM477_05885 [Boudabousia marimammalium]
MKKIINLLRVTTLILGTLTVIFGVTGTVYSWQGTPSHMLNALTSSFAMFSLAALLALILLTKPSKKK